MSVRGDIEFEVEGLRFALVPLKQKDAGRVFHTVVAQLISALSGAFSEGKNQLEGIAKELGKVDYDTIRELASILCKGAFVDEKEIKNLEDIDQLSEKPWILYRVIYEGVRGNWPRVFSDLETKVKGFVSKIQTVAGKANESGN